MLNGVEECVAGAAVILKQNGRDIGSAVTDTFGEFRIDKLEPNSGGYQIEVTGSAGRCSMTFELDEQSRYLGVMLLAA